MSPRIHGYDLGGIEPRRVGRDVKGRLRVGVVWTVVRVELAHGNGERAVDRVASAVRANGIADANRVGVSAGNDWTSLPRVLRSPVERQRLDADLSRIGGQDDPRRVVASCGAAWGGLGGRCCTIGRELLCSKIRRVDRARSVGLRETTQRMGGWAEWLCRRRGPEREISGLGRREAVGT